MKALIFDPFSGCAGDMILAALVSAGLDFDRLQSAISPLPLPEFKLEKRELMRQGLACIKVDVLTPTEHAHRHLKEIYAIIDAGRFSEKVSTYAKKIFGKLAEAEAKVHGTDPEKIHFHEVGAADAIIDIVGACCALELMQVERIFTRPIGLGGGMVSSAHGMLPIPSPATSELVQGFPIIFQKVDCELTTPTGAAIITTLAEPLGDVEQYEISAVGYGAGSHEVEGLPNILRVYLAEEVSAYDQDQILEIETNLDNQNPEFFSYLFESLLAAGALDLFYTPVQMKKNRPGVLLTVLCEPENKDKIARLIFTHSTTSGLRFGLRRRLKLPRRMETVQTSFGPVRVKVYIYENSERYYPEYEDVKNLSIQHKLSIIDLSRKLQIEIEKLKES